MTRIQRISRHIAQALALILLLMAASVASAAQGELIAALQRGGYVIYFRHAQTEWSQSDRSDHVNDLGSCDPALMRQLSAAGRETAQRVGAALRRLGIPVGDVFASEYCRAVETASLFGLGAVQTTRDILNANAAHFVGGSDALRRSARLRLSTPPAPGRNTVLVAHGNVMVLAGGQRPVEAGAAIIRPGGNGEFTVMGYIDPDDWASTDGTR